MSKNLKKVEFNPEVKQYLSTEFEELTEKEIDILLAVSDVVWDDTSFSDPTGFVQEEFITASIHVHFGFSMVMGIPEIIELPEKIEWYYREYY